MKIYSQNIYEVVEKDKTKKNILIIYNISGNHYVGITVYNKPSNKYIHIKSIDKYVDTNDLQEYQNQDIKKLVYAKGKFLKVDNKDFYKILNSIKRSLLQKMDKCVNYKDINKLNYLKWCYDKLLLETREIDYLNLKQNSVHWIDFGQNVGSELRKLRPAILWRSSSDKKMWTVIPLSTKCKKDKYYFHCDIDNLPYGTAKIESITNYSYKRIREPFFYKKKLAYISKKDYENILNAIRKYYLFEKVK